ncbi:hypothetical protein HNR46_003391 [Haloferula luteola]|uniref:Uncharacterized protein n=1 Tax=Haloferula luteola TaxID=595692 RepID=A0A840VET1_9BACT|nr:hypothetical protein [Haloferula luteola]MBB5353138.1 hypothetical protein [Haloferula luteola]
MFERLAIFIFIFFVSSVALAHQDDSGDIEPSVRVENGRFAVYFRNTTDEQSYKSVLAADGTFLSRRQKSEPPPEIGPPVELDEELEGIHVLTQDAYYVFPEWDPKHNGKPFMVKIEGREVAKMPLEWGDRYVSMIHGAAISGDTVVVTASPKEPTKVGEDFLFMIHSFKMSSAKLLHSVIIGDPIRVYWFPQDSNVLIHDGFAYVAWMSFDSDESKLNFSQFDPATGQCVTHELGRGWGNSSASIGIIGESALICFHRRVDRVVGDEMTSLAEIVYEDRNLPELFGKDTSRLQE